MKWDERTGQASFVFTRPVKYLKLKIYHPTQLEKIAFREKKKCPEVDSEGAAADWKGRILVKLRRNKQDRARSKVLHDSTTKQMKEKKKLNSKRESTIWRRGEGSSSRNHSWPLRGLKQWGLVQQRCNNKQTGKTSQTNQRGHWNGSSGWFGDAAAESLWFVDMIARYNREFQLRWDHVCSKIQIKWCVFGLSLIKYSLFIIFINGSYIIY